MGHSMGGMMSVRYALMFPSQTKRLILISPLGLEDWEAKGVPYQRPDLTFVTELATTFTSIQTYENSTYYGEQWLPEYDIWIKKLLEIYDGSQGRVFAWNIALTTDAIFTEPIFYEIENLRMRSLLLVGKLDSTAIGKAWAPEAVKGKLGRYDVLGRGMAEMLKGMDLVEFEGLGHAPQIQDFGRFWEVSRGWLGGKEVER